MLKGNLKWLVNGIGILLFFIGLAGIPDDLDTWRRWLDDAAQGNVLRWILVALGLLVVVVANVPARALQRISPIRLPQAKDDKPTIIDHDGVAYHLPEGWNESLSDCRPLCPEDFTELGFENAALARSPDYNVQGAKVGPSWGRLYCPQCGITYNLGQSSQYSPGKTVRDSIAEAKMILRAKGSI